MKVIGQTINHSQQRYETCGDWKVIKSKEDIFDIRVSDMQNDDYAFLIMVHELVEAYLCTKRGIKEEDVSAFDVEFEKNRKEDDVSEPGDADNAPYRKEHQFATSVEKLIAQELDVDWDEYDNKVTNL